MENKNIIIVLVAIVLILAAVAGVMFMQSANTKQPTEIKITSPLQVSVNPPDQGSDRFPSQCCSLARNG